MSGAPTTETISSERLAELIASCVAGMRDYTPGYPGYVWRAELAEALRELQRLRSSAGAPDKVAEALALYEGARIGKAQMTLLCDELAYCLREVRPTLNGEDLKPFFLRLRDRIDAALAAVPGAGVNVEPTPWGRAPEPSAEPVKGSKVWHEIQGLRGMNARRSIEMDIIERLLNGTSDDDLTRIDMEYWLPVHDRIRALVRKSSGGAREALNELHQIDQEIFSPEPSEQHQQALDRACYVIMELMQAYERRIRSDCITQAQIDNKPWECAEYIKGERFLKAIWKDGRAQPFAALDEFLGYLRNAPEPGVEQRLRDARYMVGMLVHKAGGRVDLSPHDMVTLDPRAELTHWDDPVGGHRIIELKLPSTKRGES